MQLWQTISVAALSALALGVAMQLTLEPAHGLAPALARSSASSCTSSGATRSSGRDTDTSVRSSR